MGGFHLIFFLSCQLEDREHRFSQKLHKDMDQVVNEQIQEA